MTDGLVPRQKPPAVLVVAAVVALAGLALLALAILLGRDWEDGAGPETGSGDPAAVVADFDRAFREADCALFQEVTTPRFRSVAQGADAEGEFSCGRWEALAAAYTVDGEYRYEQELLSSSVDGGTASVLTRERELDSGDEYSYRYTLVPGEEGRWTIDELTED